MENENMRSNKRKRCREDDQIRRGRRHRIKLSMHDYLEISLTFVRNRKKQRLNRLQKQNQFIKTHITEHITINGTDYQKHEAKDEEKSILLPSYVHREIDHLFSYGNKHDDGVKPKYENMKEEALNNDYASITRKTWNVSLKKCSKILKGRLTSRRKRNWSQILKKNGIKLRHLVALKLYTDFDSLQREFRKSFRFPYNEEIDRLESFYWWYAILRDTFSTFSKIPNHLKQPKTVFCGMNNAMSIDQFDGTYHGPISTTTDLSIARSFAGNNGMIVVLEPETNLNVTPYKVLDVSWISDYPDEKEYLLLDHKVRVKTSILSSYYDEHCESSMENVYEFVRLPHDVQKKSILYQ